MEENDIREDCGEELQRGKSVYWILGCLLVLLCAAWYGSVQWKEKLTVPQILVDGESIVSQEEILSMVNVPAGAKLYAVDLAAVARAVEANKFVKRAVVHRNPPLALQVTVVERVPVAYLAPEKSADLLMVDDDACILPRAPGRMIFDVPVIAGIAAAVCDSVGSCVKDASLTTALEVLRLTRITAGDMPQMISEVDMRNTGEIMLYAVDAGIPIRLGNGALAEKILKLGGFWKAVVAHEGMQHIKAIDLRFRDQVIVVRVPDPVQIEKKG